MQSSLNRILKQAIKQAFDQGFKRLWAHMWTRSDSVNSISITVKTAGYTDKYRSITGRQPYMVQ